MPIMSLVIGFILGAVVASIVWQALKKDTEIRVIDPGSLAIRYARRMADVSGRIYVITTNGIKREDHIQSDDIVLAIIRPSKLEDFKLEKKYVS